MCKVNDIGGYNGKRTISANMGCDILACSGGGKRNPSHRFLGKVVLGRGRPMPFIGRHIASWSKLKPPISGG